MSKQKTIHEKWNEGGITILPPKKETKKTVKTTVKNKKGKS